VEGRKSPSRRLTRSSSPHILAHRTRISARLLEPERALTTLRLSAPFARISLFGLLRAGSGSSTIKSQFVILSHFLARLERMRSNLRPLGEVRFGARRCHVALPILPGELKTATLTPVRRAPDEPG